MMTEISFNGYRFPSEIMQLQGGGHNHDPFDIVVLNNLDRYQLAQDAIQRMPHTSAIFDL